MTKEQAIKEYNSIIESRKSNPPEDGVYTETHHIVPRSCGGKDDTGNLVVLTAQEHYRAHELLPFIYARGKKHVSMVFAWHLFTTLPGRAARINANEYAMLREKYSKIVSKQAKRRWEDPEFASKMSEAAKKQWEDPEYASRISGAVKKQWEDPEYASRISGAVKKQWEDPEFVSKMSEAAKKQWEDPEYVLKQSKAVKKYMKKRWEDPEYASKMSKASKKRWEDLEFASKMSEAAKKRWEDPEYASRISVAVKKRWEDPEYASKMSKVLKENREKRMKPILALFSDNKEKRFSGLREAARELGCSASQIFGCVRGYRKTVHGIRFRYADDNTNVTTEKTTQLAN